MDSTMFLVRLSFSRFDVSGRYITDDEIVYELFGRTHTEYKMADTQHISGTTVDTHATLEFLENCDDVSHYYDLALRLKQVLNLQYVTCTHTVVFGVTI